jgi:SAM-dependent methyltransferase
MNRWHLLNRIAARLGARSYLEIGVQRGDTFSRIEVERRVGVDPDPSSAATIHEPSDSYFARLDLARAELGSAAPTFDLAFIDGLHHREQVVRDVEGAIRHLSPGGVVVVHDCNPPTEKAGGRAICSGVWCGDVWRGWIDLRRSLNREAFVVDTDLGCGVILPGDPLPPLGEESPSWTSFAADRAGWLRLVSVEWAQRRIEALAPIAGAP